MKKVAIVGSRKYTNKQRIKEFIFKLKEELEDGVEIVSGGQRDGADGYAKKYPSSNGVGSSLVFKKRRKRPGPPKKYRGLSRGCSGVGSWHQFSFTRTLRC